jgi:predicted DNA-binding protein (MmcQ/YjbR family)
MKPNKQKLLEQVRDICLALPDTKETLTWGKPHFRVKEKIFAGFDTESEVPTVGFKLEMKHQAQVLKDPRFQRAPYVGHKGWVDMDVSGIKDWDEVKALIVESYRLIAPKKSLAALDGAPVPAARKKTPAKRTAAAKR